MLIAMGIAAVLCIGIGTFPGALYAILPRPVTYVPYTAAHVISQLQLLVFSALAFSFLMRTGIYPPEMRSVNLDSDWFYRRFAHGLMRTAEHGINLMRSMATAFVVMCFRSAAIPFLDLHRPTAFLARTWSTSGMALGVMLILLAYLLGYYVL